VVLYSVLLLPVLGDDQKGYFFISETIPYSISRLIVFPHASIVAYIAQIPKQPELAWVFALGVNIWERKKNEESFFKTVQVDLFTCTVFRRKKQSND